MEREAGRLVGKKDGRGLLVTWFGGRCNWRRRKTDYVIGEKGGRTGVGLYNWRYGTTGVGVHL